MSSKYQYIYIYIYIYWYLYVSGGAFCLSKSAIDAILLSLICHMVDLFSIKQGLLSGWSDEEVDKTPSRMKSETCQTDGHL